MNLFTFVKKHSKPLLLSVALLVLKMLSSIIIAVNIVESTNNYIILEDSSLHIKILSCSTDEETVELDKCVIFME